MAILKRSRSKAKAFEDGDALITALYIEIYLDAAGVQDSGVYNADLSAEITGAIVAWHSMVHHWFDGDWDEEAVFARLTGIWTFGASRIWYLGLYNNPERQNAMYLWQLGATTEHCSTCSSANGQTKTIAEWSALNIMPQGDSLECGGYFCDCSLSEVTT